MSDYPMLISNKLHSFRNFGPAKLLKYIVLPVIYTIFFILFLVGESDL